MRIAFDMDGVLADMDGALTKLAEDMFGRDLGGRRADLKGAAEAGSASSPASASQTDPPAGEPGADLDPAREAPPILGRLSLRQQDQLWKRVSETSDFWSKLAETEAGIVAHLGRLAKERRWEVIFVTQRPPTSGQTVQVQTQRWLRKHGFELPSVYTTRGSRGKIAAALTLDALVDDRLENCVDVATESRAWSIYVARGTPDIASIEARARRMGIAVVKTVMEALEQIERAERASTEEPSAPSLLERFKRSFKRGGATGP